ncbi:HlyD family efflux transporter periplasmic adaptor subunit [Pseudomonas fluorescens]|uniref:HlyD family efflux transporter periplasmic adaptor subunit n=1 Tax=Pseudomonas fluorescens TaxID=294 RepID=A0A944HCX2_PSEFL|nr:HlyD family efflux transporter periplasmic adaptor subunit [Pseudomonas fluorescens]MBT2308754.1 HlyD family efflux transporter periplasmic adaptor subunit [Pseudomonas fluorescens]MBT2312742.1 HlyD family efflux transporter periplasmic adaptor subunit [Pseudomonas fluorescens]MBT2317871.1 HlyD family efflux transporter periplasmic adaptor subunit [Pseudomonas fluorescens]MBT2330055.1 HlyD family efflux transporter periplasmic adaptor subunit [Pseudomonas fluorescens]
MLTLNHDTSLFRTEALEAQQVQWLGSIVLIRPLSFTFLTAFATLLASIVIIFFIWGSYTKRSTIAGQLLPSSGQIKVYAPQQGRVLERFIHEGQYVKAGTHLLTLSSEHYGENSDPIKESISNNLKERKLSLIDELKKIKTLQADERKNLTSHLSSLKNELDILAGQFSSQKQLVALAFNATSRYSGLMEKGYIAMDQLQQRQAELLNHRQKLSTLERDRSALRQQITERRNELSGLSSRHENQLAIVHRTLSETDRELIENEARRILVIKAPQDGVVTAIFSEPGQTAGTARPLLSIVPNNSLLQAELYSPSKSIGFVRVGDDVRIRYQAYPYQQFGQYSGTVKSISKASVSVGELANAVGEIPGIGLDGERYYRIRVGLDQQHVLAYGEQRPLQTGMLLEADMMQETRHLYEWVLEPLYSLTGRF